jgi:ABC-type sulfate/molybdate transport systems ATPase subunit
LDFSSLHTDLYWSFAFGNPHPQIAATAIAKRMRTRVNVPKFQKFQPCRTHRRSVLVVTHDTRLLEFADRIIYIEDGALNREEAPASNVYRMRA